MRFICGVVDKVTGLRRIMTGESRPTIEPEDDLTDGGVTAEVYDWGPDASLEASSRTARLMLTCVADRATARLHADKFADEVVLKMDSERMWIALYMEIEQWLLSNRKVA